MKSRRGVSNGRPRPSAATDLLSQGYTCENATDDYDSSVLRRRYLLYCVRARSFRHLFVTPRAAELNLEDSETLPGPVSTHFFPSCCLAAATTWSGSNPNFLCNSLSGAEAPKVFMPTT